MKRKYHITSYQIVYADHSRDTVKLTVPDVVDDIKEYRNWKIMEYECVGVNLT